MALLNFLENVVKGVASPVAGFTSDVSNELYNQGVAPVLGLPHQANPQQSLNPVAGKVAQFGGATGTLRNTVGNAAGTALLGVGGGELAGAEGGIGARLFAGAKTGAKVGAGLGVANDVANAQNVTPGNLTMSFLEGGAGGAALGAVGGAVGGVISDVKAAKLAKIDNQTKIQKELEPDVGPVVAHDVAPAIAQTNDPDIVKNVISNDVNKKAPQPVEQPGQPTSPGTPDTTRSPELQAQEGMQNILNQGGTVDEALNHHTETTGGNLGQAQKALSDVTGAADTNRGKINASLNPETGKLQIPQADSNERAVLNSRMVRNQVVRVGNAATAEVDKLSKNDMDLLDQRGDPTDLVNQAEDKPQFMKAASAVKKYNDTTQALGADQLEQDVPYRQNYGAPLKFDRSTPEGEQAFQAAAAKLPTTPGYGKGRFFKNYEDASQISGGDLKRQNENFLGDLHQDIQQRQNDLAQLTLAKGLNEANPGQVSVGQSVENNTQLRIPGGNKLFMPQSAADEINQRMPAPGYTDNASGKFLKGYDTLNSNLKNFKLAGGGFHSINVVGSYLGQKLASADTYLHPVKALGDFGSVINTTFSDKAFQNTMSDMESRGRLVDADAAGLEIQPKKVAADIEPENIGQNIPVLKQIHEGIFGRQIPMLKMQLFDKYIKDNSLSRNNPEDLKQMTQFAKGLNNGFGGLDREIQGLTPKTFNWFKKGALATDYNEAQLRTLGNAFNPKASPVERKLAQQIVFGKALLFGGLATAGGAAGGEFAGKDPKQIAFDILQKAANPSFTMGGNKVGLPTTQIAEVAKPLMETVQGAKAGNPASGVENFASARLAAIPSLAEQFGTNKNFTGQKIYGNDKLGRPVPLSTTGANIASSVLPIPASQAVQTATGNQSLGAAIANTVGLRVSPQYNVQNLPAGTQTYLKEAQQVGASKDQLNAMTSYFGILRQTASDRSKATKAAVTDLAKGDSQSAQSEIAKYNQNLIKSLAPWAKQNSQFMDGAMYAQLTQNFSSPYTASGMGLLKLPSASTVKQDVQSNPTKYGLAISGGTITQ